MENKYDIVVIGAGAAGITAAKTAHELGKKVALIEKAELIGGERIWSGCIPSKTLVKAGDIAYHLKNAAKYGLSVDVTSCTMQHPAAFLAAQIQRVYQTHTPESIQLLGIDMLFGDPVFLTTTSLMLGDQTIIFRKAIIATGSTPFVPPIPGLDSVPFLTNRTLFAQPQLPKTLIIIGAGSIGLEMAGALTRLGVQVTVLEHKADILQTSEKECVDVLKNSLMAEGVVFLTNTTVQKVEKSAVGAKMVIAIVGSSDEQLEAESILVATGRSIVIPQGLETIGVEVGQQGIKVNTYLQTKISSVLACGDAVGPYRLSHMAWYQGMLAARNAIIGFWRQKADYRAVVQGIFTSPEFASFGLTEAQAREQHGARIVVYTKPYHELDRALIDNALPGLAKVVCDKKGYILGAHIVGPRATDIIHELLIAHEMRIPLYKIHTVIHAYPTYAELIWHLSKSAYRDRLQGSYIFKAVEWVFRIV